MSSHNFRNRIGERYGHLLVIEQAPNIITPNGRSHVAWKCLCDCGNEKIIRGDLLRGNSKKIIEWAIEKFFYINEITYEKIKYIQKYLGNEYNIFKIFNIRTIHSNSFN